VTIRAVTFDYWQTLVSERRGDMRAMQIDRWVATLTEAGQRRSAEAIAAAFAENWSVFEDRWRTNGGPYGAEESVGFVAGHLALDLDQELRRRLLQNFRIVGETAPLQMAPGLERCLAALRAAGVRLGIVCDVGLTDSQILRRRLAWFGVLDAFDAFAFSDETGWFKPAAGAFEPALAGLGVTPDETAHVGDNERTDIAGAKAMGMVAVQYTGLASIGAWLPEQEPGSLADHVLDDLAVLPAVLDVA
jgi:putative hydrolase of the HAD superfamily